ncbi:HNH endonuclease [Hymenobacter sp. J193]|uniref:HNH endonuclease n=1 Tax=Hymenobacter sp. J193 TaxID=2898429 RepID=UPI002151EB61|nr:HNH endonuclease [Hymenobacter sp. J193]MCR5888344.1 HNH endonuclease [Hymenobacter sp. J193]
MNDFSQVADKSANFSSAYIAELGEDLYSRWAEFGARGYLDFKAISGCDQPNAVDRLAQRFLLPGNVIIPFHSNTVMGVGIVADNPHEIHNSTESFLRFKIEWVVLEQLSLSVMPQCFQWPFRSFSLWGKLTEWYLGQHPELLSELRRLSDILAEDISMPLSLSAPSSYQLPLPGRSTIWAEHPKLSGLDSTEWETYVEDGTGRFEYGPRYERNRKLRGRAVEIHGLTCRACGFNFEQTYGVLGRGFIHVHHLKPISQTGGPTEVNPHTDMVVLCANCHAMVHRQAGELLSVEKLRELISANRRP